MIISGDKLAYMEPQEKIWRGESGQSYPIREICARNKRDSLAPFKGVAGYSVQAGIYPGTLFRFPLRNTPSDLSENLYTIQKLQDLLVAIREEAKFLLLFLRSVQEIEVYEISQKGKQMFIQRTFQVAIQEKDAIARKRKDFMVKLQAASAQARPPPYCITSSVELVTDFHVKVTDHSSHTTTVSHWLVANQVGPQNQSEQSALDSAAKQHVFPWVGVALELNRGSTSPTSPGGRIFCFLPMPTEASCFLPVHVNGTFALNDDRRTLKWPGTERKNDPAADWNKTLVSELLPPCYARLLMEAKKHLRPEQFYEAWPEIDEVTSTPWKGLLLPLFRLLFKEAVVWTSGEGTFGGQWIALAHGTFIPQGSSLSSVVHSALSNCDIKLVKVPDRVWDGIALKCTDCRVQLLSPSIARSALRSHPGSYQDSDAPSKFDLLGYCLSDENYSDLDGLTLLPLADGRFIDFKVPYLSLFSHMRVKERYICSDEYPRDLLPNIDNLLVDLQENVELRASLQSVASSQQTQLRNLSVQLVAQLLSECFPAWQRKTCVSIASSSSNAKWFERFWRWVRPHSLKHFTDKMVLPLTSERGEPGFQVTRLKETSSVVCISEEHSSELLSALTKLRVRYTQSDEFPYLHHRNLFLYLNRFDTRGLFTAITNACHGHPVSQLQSVMLTPTEAYSLQLFLSTGSKHITAVHESVLHNLPIFTVLNRSRLYSVAEAKRASWLGRAILEPDSFDISPEHLPKNLVVFSRSQNQRRLLDGIDAPNRIDFVLNFLFPMISGGAYPDTMLDSLMEEVLQLSAMLKSQFPYSGSELTYQITNLAFLRINPSSIRKPPNQLFDPTKEDLRELFKGEEAFPIHPFNHHLQHLRKHGLRQTVTGQEIVDIVNSISTRVATSPQKVPPVSVSRAKAVLNYLNANPHVLTEKVIVSRQFSPLKQALQTLAQVRSWLPVYSVPPRNYPKYLVWKGRSCTSHLTSLSAPVLLCNADDARVLPFIVGSQMFLVQSSSSEICSLLNAVSAVPLSYAVAHLQHVIKHCCEDDTETISDIVYPIYKYLHAHFSDLQTMELHPDIRTFRWIWIERQHTFFSPSEVALERNSTFRQDLEPYLHVLPYGLRKFSKLFAYFGVERSFSVSQIVSVLKMIKDKKATGRQTQSIVISILKWLTDDGQKPADIPPENLYVPIETRSGKLKLVKASSVVYSDNRFIQNYLTSNSESEESYIFVNHCINSEMARNLGLTPLSRDFSENTFEDTGQYEPLTVRLKNILKDYKDGLTIVKELLQNADDAEATEVNICYDARQHTVKPRSLFFPGMHNCHGPALLVHNNAVFTENDFKNITKLAAATKMDQPLKIGKFGVGFCSVYHITDIPSFVSCEFLHIFDPTLKYLGNVVKDSTRPGQRIRFTDKIVASSKQLAPYAGLYEFDPKTETPYDGTIFRFPFRTSPSDISHIVYNEGHIKQLVTDLQKSGSKLLLFLRNVQQITFSRIDAGDRKPKLLMKVKRNYIKEVLSRSSECLAHVCHIGTTSLPEQYWLVSSHTCEIQHGTHEKYATASVACLLDKKTTSNSSKKQTTSYLPNPVKGEVFCFLPLALQTGLPVHVSSNFAVMTDRRGIRSSDDDSQVTEEVQWNTDLMEQIIPEAYHSLLEALQCMCVQGSVHQEAYDFFCLWPLRESLKTHNPWDALIHPLFELISSSELFFSKCTAQWMTLLDSKFLSPHILCHSSTSALSTPQCVISVVERLCLPVVNLPAQYQEHLSPDIESCTVDEKGFLEIFFDNIDSLRQIRNKVLRCLLLAFAVDHDSTNRKNYLQDYLERNESVPCSPKGTELKRCSDLIDPNAYFAGLYDPEEGMFPIKDFPKHNLINTALLQLKMISKSLPWSMLTDRARTIQGLYTKDRYKTLERVRLLIKCIKNNISQSTDDVLDVEALSVADEAPELTAIKFLPVMQKPPDYPLKWYCDLSWETVNLLSPGELLCGERHVILAGSKAPIVCEAKPKEGGCGIIPHSVLSFLGIQTSARMDTVVSQLCQLIEAFSSQPELYATWTERACAEIYTFLEAELSTSRDQEEDLSDLHDTNSVWTGKEFVKPEAVAITNWSHNGPYLFRLPDILLHKTNLLAALNIKNCFSLDDFLRTLQEMHEDFGSEPVSEKCQKLIPTLVNELTNIEDLPENIKCYLPDTSFAMCEANRLAYNDAKWCEVDEECTFVNDIIPRELATKLGVKLIRSKLLERYESIHHFGVGFGQCEPLTQRIKNILREYPLDITILKELLQNADDSKATRMYVILDKRTHGTMKLPSNNWRELQGPSILVWNDSIFSESDLKGIQALGLGSKRSDAETIGQYGIGFNVVYHLTDCPSFLTNGSMLCVFDPHCRYVPGADMLTPGRRYDKLDEMFWSNWADLKSAYLRERVSDCPHEMMGGSLFRFPLRFTTELMKQSELVDHEKRLETLFPWRMEGYLKEWAPDMKEALIFLNHVTDLRFYVIENGRNPKMQLQHHFKVKIDQAAVNNLTQLHKETSAFTRDSESCVITYALELIDAVPKESSKWLVQQGVGDVGCGDKCWSFVPEVKPKHGIATPLNPSNFKKAYVYEYRGPSSGSGASGGLSGFSVPSTDFSETSSGFRGKVFCFLPLPLYSNLPVHVNGNFILDASRRDLWHPTVKDKPDDRSRWNLELMEAIASSFADFLVKCQNSFIMSSVYNSHSKMRADILMYYRVFPRWLGHGFVQPEGELLKVAKMVYQKLATQNAKILATIKKLSATAAAKYHSSSSKSKFQVEWHPLVNKEEPSKQAYFWHPEEHERSLAPILKSIGMQLCAAPMNLYRHFPDDEIELSVASRKSVYEYYMTFYEQATSTSPFPCHISETAFHSVPNFKEFTRYLLCTSSGTAMYEEFPEPPFTLPLLLTADGQLRFFTETEKVIRSDFAWLFPESPDKFLHPDLLEIEYVPAYFQQPSSENCNWILVSSILSAVLPNTLRAQRVLEADKHIQIASLLKPLWICLTSDAIFSHHLETVVREWALLPSTTHELFSFRSDDQLLPVVPASSATPTLHRDVFQIIQQVGMPILDTGVVDPDQCGSFCPTLSEPKGILINLYYLHNDAEECLSTLLTDKSVDRKISLLFEYLKQIHFAQDESSLLKLKCLPLFKNIDGNFYPLIGDVYIWPGYICMAGSENWLRREPAVFLKQDGVWSKLGPPSLLGITEITPTEVYVKFVFPNFGLLTDEDRLKQLQHIRDQLFSDAYKSSKFTGDMHTEGALIASQFIATLKQLPCLPKEGILRPVCEFCDPKAPIFFTFPECFSFPQDELCDDKWLEFFRKIGLRTSVTQDEFLQFCRRVSIGDHTKLREASSVLLRYLFQFTEWYEQYEFLSQVSEIPFVCAEKLERFSWIRPVCPAENRIQQGKRSTDLTKLCDAAQIKYGELVWTVKPVIRLPTVQKDMSRKLSENFKTFLRINTPPTVQEVVQNVYNISETRFSRFDLFDNYPEDCRMKKRTRPDQSDEVEEKSLLLTVMCKNFDYLRSNYCHEGSLDKLCGVTCIPVCVEGKTSDISCPVLVKPLQVLASSTETPKHFRPLLNPLPDDLYSVLPGLLSVLGVQSDIHLEHVRFALETASTFRQPLDVNTESTVRHLLIKLYHLLQTVSPTAMPSLSPLYLPTTEHQLIDSQLVLYHDSRYFEKGHFDLSKVPYALLSLLASRTETQGITIRKFCNSLPSNVCPKALLECYKGELHESCADSIDETLSGFAKKLQKSLSLPVFPKAAYAILKHNSNGEELCSQFTDSLKIFLQRAEIVSVRNLQVNVFLKLVKPAQKIGTAKVDFLLQRNEESIFLYVDSEAYALRLNFFELLTSVIVSCVAEIGEIDVKSLKEPDLAVSHLLKAETTDDVSKLLEDLEVPFELSDVDLQDSFDPNLTPKLGSSIPDSWHHRLQLDINNVFRPEEWVGYEEREGCITFALVAHRVAVSDEQSSESEDVEPLDQYLIYTQEGDEKGKVVSVIDLYKILRAELRRCVNEEAGTELVLFDPDSDATQVWSALEGDEFKKFRKEICEELRRIWKLLEDLRRKAIKALYLKWHPDKNSHPLATKAFQFLQRQITRLQAGKSLEDHEGVDESGADETSSNYYGWFDLWDEIARSQRRAREQERSTRSAGQGGVSGGFYTRPRPMQTTAAVWIRQAEADLEALRLLLARTDRHPQVCAHVCFLAHEVAEKALKAGMYAVCGLHPESLRYHELDGHAGALEQERPALTVDLGVYARSLRVHYLKTRFPNQYSTPTVPSDVYTQDQARDAENKAQKIFDMMTQVVQTERAHAH